jgi:hypothetical protein
MPARPRLLRPSSCRRGGASPCTEIPAACGGAASSPTRAPPTTNKPGCARRRARVHLFRLCRRGAHRRRGRLAGGRSVPRRRQTSRPARAVRAPSSRLCTRGGWSSPQQHPYGIDCRPYHTDVVAVGRRSAAPLHELAFVDPEASYVGALRTATRRRAYWCWSPPEGAAGRRRAGAGYPFNSAAPSIQARRAHGAGGAPRKARS